MRRILLLLAALALICAPAASAKKAPVVGSVVAVKKASQLKVRVGGKLKPLRKGAKLRLGQEIVMGAAVRATLRLKRPKGVAATRDLVRLKPASGADPVVSISRKGKRTTIKIRPG